MSGTASPVAREVVQPVASPVVGDVAGGGTPPVPVTIAIFLGQSNADGWSLDPANSTALTIGYGYEYYHSSPVGVLLPLGRNRLGRTQGGPQSAFCQTWATGGGGPVICVDCACGGSSMTAAYKASLTGTTDLAGLSGGTWDQLDAANVYDNYYKTHIDNAIRDVVAAGFSVEHLVVYFSQGEQDSLGGSPQATYETSLRLFLDSLKADFPAIVVLVEALGTNSTASNSAASTLIRNGQIAVAAEPAYSGWVTIAANLAKDFSAAGKFADTLHYNQTGYNELGVAVATAGLSFVGSPSIVADVSFVDSVLADLPAITGWKRVQIDTAKSGSWNVQFYSDPTTPYAVTWFDGSGENSASADQSTTFTFGSTAVKRIVGYVSDTIGASGNMVGGSTCAATALGFPDSGIKINSVNFSTAGACAGNFVCAEADLLRLDASTARFIAFDGNGSRTNVLLSNAILLHLSGLTTLINNNGQPADISLLNTPNLGRFDAARSGMSVAQVNQVLIDLDTNGLSTSKQTNVSQFSVGLGIPNAAPTGAGATAKTSLQGKGWTVTTD